MRGARRFLLLALPAALAAGGCMRSSSPAYTMVDPNTVQQYAALAPPAQSGYAQSAYVQPSQGFELYGQSGQQSYARQMPAQTPAPDAANDPIPNRGLFTSTRRPGYSIAPQAQAQTQPQQPYVMQYGAPSQQAVLVKERWF